MDTENGHVTFTNTNKTHSFESIDMLIEVLENLDDALDHSGSISFNKNTSGHTGSPTSLIVFSTVSKEYLIDFAILIKKGEHRERYIV